MDHRLRQILSAIAAIAALALLAVPATAHGGREVVGYGFTVGFIGEPVFAGQKSGLEFYVEKDETPKEGLEETLKAQVIFADQTRDLEVSARFGAPGWYESVFFPTAAGLYRIPHLWHRRWHRRRRVVHLRGRRVRQRRGPGEWPVPRPVPRHR